jgi:glycosyltransferase involved in cell wall biosynthesis
MKPKILVVVDVPGWSLERTADNVMARLKDRYRFAKAFNHEAAERIGRGDFDLLYLSYWKQFIDAGLLIEMPRPCISGIRSHFKWDGGCSLPPSREALAALRQFTALNVPSRNLFEIFKNRHPAVFYTPHGVDAELFRPLLSGHKSSPQGELVLGWAGSRSNHPGKRGLDDFLIPALEGLSGVKLSTAAREDRWRSAVEMVDWYRGLDAYICCSRTEGGPHPVLEASACGIPVISTRVGLVPELIETGLNGLLVEREVADIRGAIVQLRDDRELRVIMGKNARRVIEQGWTWDHQASHYIPFFDRALT